MKSEEISPTGYLGSGGIESNLNEQSVVVAETAIDNDVIAKALGVEPSSILASKTFLGVSPAYVRRADNNGIMVAVHDTIVTLVQVHNPNNNTWRSWFFLEAYVTSHGYHTRPNFPTWTMYFRNQHNGILHSQRFDTLGGNYSDGFRVGCDWNRYHIAPQCNIASTRLSWFDECASFSAEARGPFYPC